MAEGLPRRVSSKITRLPPEVREQLEDGLQDTSITFEQHSEWLKEQGYDISSSAVYRHARHIRLAAQRIADALEKTRLIAQVVEKSPEADYTKASRIMAMEGLMQKVSSAEDEFLEMPIEKAVRLINSLSRTELTEQKARRESKSKMELAFDSMEKELSEKIMADPQLRREFQSVMDKARQRLFGDEE